MRLYEDSILIVWACLQVLKDELAGPVHALSLDTKTEQEDSS